MSAIRYKHRLSEEIRFFTPDQIEKFGPERIKTNGYDIHPLKPTPKPKSKKSTDGKSEETDQKSQSDNKGEREDGSSASSGKRRIQKKTQSDSAGPISGGGDKKVPKKGDKGS